MLEFDKTALDKATKDFQKLGKDNYEAVVKSYGQMNKGFQDIGTSFTDYTKQAFAEATATFEKLVGAKSLEHAIEIQSEYAKKAYETWLAEVTKIGEMYASVARDAYKPVEKAVEKTTATVTAS
ncbi:phasin family protein [Methyloceanibacter caenitepidi]|uniref:Mll0665 protein n=1 Tax=Methyloceanibacter caenitepidi TaxID=1384459 RepID=A0A0A8K7C6_9HYPH|nr:phasin family protein [Methyloceanibacter caenitepidi]BAQ18417.1 Mll0665 protein [Methyloceanibacter caenitepidi]